MVVVGIPGEVITISYCTESIPAERPRISPSVSPSVVVVGVVVVGVVVVGVVVVGVVVVGVVVVGVVVVGVVVVGVVVVGVVVVGVVVGAVVVGAVVVGAVVVGAVVVGDVVVVFSPPQEATSSTTVTSTAISIRYNDFLISILLPKSIPAESSLIIINCQ